MPYRKPFNNCFVCKKPIGKSHARIPDQFVNCNSNKNPLFQPMHTHCTDLLNAFCVARGVGLLRNYEFKLSNKKSIHVAKEAWKRVSDLSRKLFEDEI